VWNKNQLEIFSLLQIFCNPKDSTYRGEVFLKKNLFVFISVFLVSLSLNAKETDLSINLEKGISVDITGHQGGYLGHPRDYNATLTQVEIDSISYIVNTLAFRSLVSILKCKGELEAAGDRVDQVHPLRFLEVIFTSEQLKAGIRSIRGRGWIWGDFLAGFKNSLATESQIGNMTKAQINDFAAKVGINPNIITPSIEARNWDQLMDSLITQIPRRGNHDRYDD